MSQQLNAISWGMDSDFMWHRFDDDYRTAVCDSAIDCYYPRLDNPLLMGISEQHSLANGGSHCPACCAIEVLAPEAETIDLAAKAGPHGLSWLQNARLLRMTRSGGPRTNASGPTHPDYRALFDLGLVAIGSTKYPHPQHWLRLTDSAPLRAWEAELTEKEKACLAVAYAYIEEEYTNSRLVNNGFPDKQTYHYVGRPTHYALALVPIAPPVPQSVALPAPGTQFNLFGQEVTRG